MTTSLLVRFVRVFLCAGLLFLAGCAERMSADVTRFNQLDPGWSGSFAVTPMADQQGSLAFENYAGMLSSHLVAVGFTPVSGNAMPDYVAQLEYSRTQAREVTGEDGPVNVGVGVGGGSRGTSLGVGLGVNLGSGSRDAVIYMHKLSVFLTRQADGQRVFEGYASTEDGNEDVRAVMPYLMDAVFRDFPGNNGETTTVEIKTGN